MSVSEAFRRNNVRVVGEGDRTVAVGRYLAGRIPGARLAVIDAYGHLPHLSAPAAVNEALRRFLS
ncbi:alpha/beta fold hydrolase [Sorangium sp. So ce385]|uniref:alpha/beta fold hydrolase n=1 Tax=Sorangium sp. So ce385 TaxID=3133308 RepID=UPI003F5BA817